jgi:hypothetical protein
MILIHFNLWFSHKNIFIYTIYLKFIYGLFNDAVHNLDSTESKSALISKLRIRVDSEGSGRVV